jgi:hypothetical protein
MQTQLTKDRIGLTKLASKPLSFVFVQITDSKKPRLSPIGYIPTQIVVCHKLGRKFSSRKLLDERLLATSYILFIFQKNYVYFKIRIRTSTITLPSTSDTHHQ